MTKGLCNWTKNDEDAYCDLCAMKDECDTYSAYKKGCADERKKVIDEVLKEREKHDE